MAIVVALIARLAHLAPWLTRLAAKAMASPMRLLAGKPFERKLLVYQLPQRQLALVNDPDLVQRVLLDRAGTFPKSTVVGAVLQPMIGAGVFGQPGGERVRAQRRRFIGALAQISDAEALATTAATTRVYLSRWLARPAPVGICSALARLTIDVVSQATLGHTFTQAESERFVALFFAYHQQASPLLLVLGRQSQAATASIVRNMGLHDTGEAMRALVKARFVAPILAREPQALGAPLAAALMEGDVGGPDALLDEITVMLLAGHETAASTLSWLFWELANRPAEQCAASFLLTGGDPADERAGPWRGATGPQLACALTQEALRLYPPIAFFMRETLEAQRFRGRAIAAGSFLMAAPWALHRHRGFWKQPDDFLPGRWLEPGFMPAPSSFIPFGLGPRACPGQRFANIEMHEIIRQVLCACALSPADTIAPEPLGSLTSRPNRDVLLGLHARPAATTFAAP